MNSITTPLTLLDAAERERAENDLSLTYLVEAAAGTGKTTLLVRRILTIIRTTLTPLTRVAAITFTEKAAGELKVKLREQIERCIREESGEEERQFRRALLDLDAMPVSTIHAFCRDLISQRPVEAGIDPGFGVCDEAGERILRDEAWMRWIERELDGGGAAAASCLRRGLKLESARREASLRELHDLLVDYREELDAIHVAAPDALQAGAQWTRLLTEMQQHLDLCRECKSGDDSLYRELQALGTWLRQYYDAQTSGVLLALQSLPRLNRSRKGKAANWPAGTLELLRSYFFEKMDQDAKAIASQYLALEAGPLIQWLKGGVREYTDLKLSRSLLDFHDLLLLARDMLRDSRDAREYFKARYDYLLVDEFQDTDPLQTEIVFYLAEKPGQFTGQWEDVEVDPGRLFVVGDPKQSIYRFRRADLDLYGKVKRKVETDGMALAISMNFRSHPDILAEVNAVFEPVMIGATPSRYEPDYVAMQPARAGTAEGPAVLMLPPPEGAPLDSRVSDLAAAEASAISQCLSEMVRNGRCRYGDSAILYHTTTYLAALENALRGRGIPYQVTGGRDLPRRSEIQALRTVLAALDNPHDSMSVIGALRSPFFSCSDEDLLRHRMQGGDFNYIPGESEVESIHDAFSVLRGLHRERAQQSPAQLIMRLLETSGGLYAFALKPQGESRAANLLRICDLARSLEAAGNTSLHSLTHWLDHLEEMRLGEDESLAEAGDDVVQLMTLHKAKGLEFPVVFLFGLGREQEKAPDFALIDRTTARVELRLADQATEGYERLATEERDRAWHETMRLLYVGMTRARDLLVCPLYWCKPAANRSKQWFLRVLDPRYAADAGGMPRIEGTKAGILDTHCYTLETPISERLVVPDQPLAPETVRQSEQEHESWRAQWSARRDALQKERWFIKPSDHSEPDAPVEMRPSAQPAAADSAAAFGSFVHRVMERVDLVYGANLEPLLAEAAMEFQIDADGQDRGREMIKAALQSDLFRQRIARSNPVYRELEFVAELDGRIVEGFMDLVFIEANSAVILDYKTDRVAAPQVPAYAGRYRRQAAAYLLALERIGGRSVREVLFYFLHSGVTHAFRREDLVTTAL